MRQKLLIVDDEPGIVDMLKSYFDPQYEVLTAYSGDEALRKVAAVPDLILLDINMPGMDGLAVCRKKSGSMRRSGGWRETAAAMWSWNISGRSGRNLVCIRCTAILRQSGGAGTNGTVKKYGTAAVFFPVVGRLSGSGIAVDSSDLFCM